MGICKLCRTVQTENMIDLQGAGRLYGRKQMKQKRIVMAGKKRAIRPSFFEDSAINIRRTEESTACLEFSRRQFCEEVKKAAELVNDGVILHEAGVDLLGKSDKKCSILLWV